MLAPDDCPTPTAPRVAVVIPAYQGGTDLLACLASVAASRPAPDAVWLVDNASRDGSIEAAMARFPDVQLLRHSANLGFGAACNQGLQRAWAAGCDFALLLNQDATLEPGALASLLDCAAAHPHAGIIGAKTLSPELAPDGTPLLLYAGAWRTRLPLWQRIPGIGGSSRNLDPTPIQVDYVWGHAMLLRRQTIEQVGAFDPGFFMYFEDLDLCRRAAEHGWEIWCDNRAVAWHAIEDGSRARGSSLLRWRWKQASARYFHRKHYPRLTADLLWAMTMLREAVSLLRHRHFVAAAHLVRAWLETALR